MARNQRTYDNEYKAQAVKLAQEIGGAQAAKELGIPDGYDLLLDKSIQRRTPQC